MSKELLDAGSVALLVVVVISPLLGFAIWQGRQLIALLRRDGEIRVAEVESRTKLADAMLGIQDAMKQANAAQVDTAAHLVSMEKKLTEVQRKIEALPAEMRAEVIETFDGFLDKLTNILKQNSLIPQNFSPNGHRRGGLVGDFFRVIGGG